MSGLHLCAHGFKTHCIDLTKSLLYHRNSCRNLHQKHGKRYGNSCLSHFYVQSCIVLFVSVFCLLYSIVLHCLKAFVANDFTVYCMWPHEYWTSRFTKTRGQLYRGRLFFSSWSWLVFEKHVVA